MSQQTPVVPFEDIALWLSLVTRRDLTDILLKDPNSRSETERAALEECGFCPDIRPDKPLIIAASQHRDDFVKVQKHFSDVIFGFDSYSGGGCPEGFQFSSVASLDKQLA